MQKIAFYINNPKLPNRDYRDLEKGNPGLPGSEYEFLLVSQLLDKRNNGLKIYLLANFEGIFSHSQVLKVTDLECCCKICKEMGIKTMVVDVKYFDREVMDKHPQLDYIIWAHNFMSIKQLTLFNELEYIKRIVCVGREVMELFRDHPVSWKTNYIYNIFPVQEKRYYEGMMKNDEGHNVVYMGCLIEEKGFHLLAKAWKQIVKQVPDAQLYVIGNGRLYDKDAPLGQYGQASPEYESMFMPYLTDDEGKVLDSVHFMGVMGNEKYDIIRQCKVGIPNPSGQSETFCISALEMQLYGDIAVSIKVPAYIDTFANNSFLYKHEEDLAQYVIKALHSENNYDKAYAFIYNRFGIDANIKRWEKLFAGSMQIEPISSHRYRLKGFKNIMLYAKRRLPILNRVPIVEKWYNACYMKANRRAKIILPNR